MQIAIIPSLRYAKELYEQAIDARRVAEPGGINAAQSSASRNFWPHPAPVRVMSACSRECNYCMFESLTAPGSEQPRRPMPGDFNEMVGKILQFVFMDEGTHDSLVFEATLHKSNHARRDSRGGRPKAAFVRTGSTGQRIGLTQREIATILRVSERAVRNIERRAIKKLLAHPGLRQIWKDYLSGQLDEGELALTPREVEALFGLVRTREEWLVVRKVLRVMRP